MTSNKKPSIYNDRSTIGSSEELDEYGVWVKSEPQDFSAGSGMAESFVPDMEELPDLSLDSEFQGFDTTDENNQESMNLDIPDWEAADEDAAAQPSGEAGDSDDDEEYTEISMDDFLDEKTPEFTEISLDDYLDEKTPEFTEVEVTMDDFLQDITSSFTDFTTDISDEESRRGLEDINMDDNENLGLNVDETGDGFDYGESSSEDDEDFDDIAAVSEELQSSIESTAKSASAGKPDLSTELLMKIANELASIKSELSGLKAELAAQAGAASGEGEKGGFFGEEDDEKISLTGDELDNILHTADFTEETGEDATGGLDDDGFGSFAGDEETSEAGFEQSEDAELETSDFLMDQPDIIDDMDSVVEDTSKKKSEAEIETEEQDEEFDINSFDTEDLEIKEEITETIEDAAEEQEPSEEASVDLSAFEESSFDESSIEETAIEETAVEETAFDESSESDEFGIEESSLEFESQDITEDSLESDAAAPGDDGASDDEGETLELSLDSILDMTEEKETTSSLDDSLLNDDLISFDENLDSEFGGTEEAETQGIEGDSFDMETGSVDAEETGIDHEEIQKKDSEDLKHLREEGVVPMTPAPEDTSYLEESLDLTNAVIDEPDFGEVVDNPINEPSLDALNLDMELEEPFEEEGLEEEKLEDESFDDIELPVEDEEGRPDEESFASVLPEGFVVDADESQSLASGDDGAFDEDLESVDAAASIDLADDLTPVDDFSAGFEDAREPEEVLSEAEDESEISKLDASLSPGLKQELKTILSYMDHLLESLPEDKIEEFARSEYYDTYKKLFEELGLI